ncbi:MAG: hypothetical protein GY856_13465 [bacterium]|nr:hypothetical protein [bacterium]
MRRFISILSVSLLALLGPALGDPALADPAPTPASPRLVLVSWDGAADWVVDRLLAEGRLPHLARLAARGVAAEHSLSSYPSKTAVGHAALWTGCWSDCNGITANDVLVPPAAEHTLLEIRNGFRSEALLAEPLFVTAARAGKKVVVLTATQYHPPTRHLESLRRAGVPDGRYLTFSGFESEIAARAMLDAAALRPAGADWGDAPRRLGEARELRFSVGDTRFRALVFDDPDDPTDGFDTVLVRRQDGAEALLKPRPAEREPAGWSASFRVRRGELRGNTFFRLFELSPDGSSLALYQRQANALQGAHTAEQLAAYQAACSGFYDDPFWGYRDGWFGRPLLDGGDGTAEDRILEIVAFDTELLKRGTRFAFTHWQPDVLFHYSPMTDSAGHSWCGLVDPRNPGHDPRMAAKIWPYYARVFQELDSWLGEIMELASPETIVALVSDHGMAGVSRNFHLNRALEQAGLLARTDSGRIDLARTRVLAYDSGFFVRVNDRAFKGGIVGPEDRGEVLAAAAEALLEARDPETGRHVVHRLFWPQELPGLGIDGPWTGDLYVDLAPGYQPATELATRLVTPTRWPWGEGEHGYWPMRRAMHAIFYAMGPGLREGVLVPPIRIIDVAPTLSYLMGIPAPPQARGELVDRMLLAP